MASTKEEDRVKRHLWLVGLAVACVAVAASALAASASYGSKGKHSANQIEVFSLWSGSEQAAFLKVTKQFTQKSGIDVKYISGRNFIPEISARLASGSPPDLAIVPRPGYLTTLAHQGVLKPLTSLGISTGFMNKRYASSWLGFGKVGGKLYGMPAKANSKTVVWYKPNSFKKYHFKVPKTWSQLLTITRKYQAKGQVPWAIGDGPNQSQWVLTDWFENIYARTAGAAKYQRLFTGKLPFTDSSVAKALNIMLQIVNNKYALGGVQGILGTSFQDGIGEVFGTNPKAQMYMEGGFVGGLAIGQFNSKLKPGVTIDSFPWPTINAKADSPVIVGADYAVAFKDNPEVRQFLNFIGSAQAGKTWVSTAAVESVNKLVPGNAYPNLLTRKEGHQLASAKIVRFDGSDQMPGAFGDTWGFALQDVIQHPGNIKSILAKFQSQIKGKWGS
jgi:alpha-glucoside transport system substrate-binding protein